jgi:thiol-disulfide isomerase/thioredoxin
MKKTIYSSLLLLLILSACIKEPTPGETYGVAPAMTFYDQNSNQVSLSSFKGQYILLDFWASWCSPCIKEFPFLKQAYTNYKSKGFEIVSVSIDKDLTQWNLAINYYGLFWPHHFVDPNDFDAPSLKAVFNKFKSLPEGIPTNLLIDKNGEVVAFNLRGENIEPTLAKFIQ